MNNVELSHFLKVSITIQLYKQYLQLYLFFNSLVVCWCIGAFMATVIQYLQFYSLYIQTGQAISFSSLEKVLFVACLSAVLTVRTS